MNMHYDSAFLSDDLTLFNNFYLSRWLLRNSEKSAQLILKLDLILNSVAKVLNNGLFLPCYEH